ncbi:hypothetical protein CWRG_02601 [Chthonomonas calidirosea]|nr:hypothetical protein [Chthonomonas calidirosea]CEK19736.1 hypothetical protein CWRG_02601 [Chthonomonas calidirosea]CEK19742.1 hypothetical protein CP488_02623 [Chthonomonas calidirosea]
MSFGKRLLLFIVLPLMAAIFQFAWAGRIAIEDATPQLPLLLTTLGATFCTANEGAVLGFINGFLFASISPLIGGGLGGLIMGSTLVGFGIGWLGERVFRGSTFLAPFFAAAGTLVAALIYLVAAPPPILLHWLLVTGKTTLYNMVLAIPLYPLLRWLLGAHQNTHAIA